MTKKKETAPIESQIVRASVTAGVQNQIVISVNQVFKDKFSFYFFYVLFFFSSEISFFLFYVTKSSSKAVSWISRNESFATNDKPRTSRETKGIVNSVKA